MWTQDLKWWCGLVAAVCTALIGSGGHLVPEPYNHVVAGLGIAATAIAGYCITPQGSIKE